ncbi:MAG: hypothetical protein ACQKBU_09100 [Verrucomicrobiales bacterium]
MKTIASFELPESAWLFRNYLTVHDVDAYVFDEYIVQVRWDLSNAIGGVRVVVPPAQQEMAVQRWLEYRDRLYAPPSTASVVRGGLLGLIASYVLGVYPVFGRRVVDK